MKTLDDYIASEGPALSKEYDIPEDQVRHLIGIYGTRTPALLERIRGDRRLLSPLYKGGSEVLVQVDHAVQEEMALRLSDFLQRRTALALTRNRRNPEMIDAVAMRMGDLLGWDAAHRQEEIQRYLGELS